MDKLTQIKETLKVRIFGFMQIPMIWFVAPRVIAVGVDHTEISIALNRRTRNHLKSMYFGALAVGADLAGALLFMNLIEKEKLKVSFVFKDMSVSFLKRADGDVHFVSKNGTDVELLVKKIASTPDRHETTVEIKALVPSKYGEDPVAIFKLTLSAKRKS